LALAFLFLHRSAAANGQCTPDFALLHKQALAESLIPVRCGIPGVRTFWNIKDWRFIHAPAFDFPQLHAADCYRFTLTSQTNNKQYSFTAAKTSAALTPVWQDVPVGKTHLTVEAIKNGNPLKNVGEKDFYHAAVFNGPYNEPASDYEKNAKVALENLFRLPFVNYWLKTGEPDPNYHDHYRYNSKIVGALVKGAAYYCSLKPTPQNAPQVRSIGQICAQYLLDTRYDQPGPLQGFFPTYHDMEVLGHMHPNRNMLIYRAQAAGALLDWYDLTREEKYFLPAIKVADIYEQQQLDNGTWYLLVTVAHAKPVADNIIAPTAVLAFLERLHNQYNIHKYQPVVEKALHYPLTEPLKTFSCQNQYEDQPQDKPYHNLSRREVSDVAQYLLAHAPQNPFYLEMALELIRFIEHQFVVWQNPTEQVTIGTLFPEEFYYSKHWFTPCVCEQYKFFQPVIACAARMISLYKTACLLTADTLFLQKAIALANTITINQAYHHGRYTTCLTRVERDYWTNCTVYTACEMIDFDKFIKKHHLAVAASPGENRSRDAQDIQATLCAIETWPGLAYRRRILCALR